MSRATEVYSREFDSILFKLPSGVRQLIEAKFTMSARDLVIIRITSSKASANIGYAPALSHHLRF